MRPVKDELGYSLVEVMASIMILTLAITPMVGMFDMGLESAVLGANYDKARALANKQLERAQGLPYDDPYGANVVDVKNDFPTAGSAPSGGSFTSSSQSDGDFPGFTYTVTKRYKCVSSSTSSCDTATGSTVHLANASTDRGIMEIRVTVRWDGNKTYTATGIKSR